MSTSQYAALAQPILAVSKRLRVFINLINDGDKEDPPPGAAAPLLVNPPRLPGKPQVGGEKQASEAVNILKVRGLID